MDSIDNINAILIQHRVFLQYTDDWPRDHLSKWPFHQHTYLAHVLIYQYWGGLRKWKVVIIRLDFFLPWLALIFAETLIYLTILNPGGKKQTWISFLSKSQFDVSSNLKLVLKIFVLSLLQYPAQFDWKYFLQRCSVHFDWIVIFFRKSLPFRWK